MGQHQSTQTTTPTLDEEGKLVLEPKATINIKERRLCSRIIKEYLIKWKSCPEEDASWETEKFIQQHPHPSPALRTNHPNRRGQCYIH